MMVGLPGRFLRQPMYYSLIPLSEARAWRPGEEGEGDRALQLHYKEEGDRIFSDYAIRPEYDRESTALSHVGAYIVMKMRVELYDIMKREHENGRTVIRTYIDCYALNARTSMPENIGTGKGQWKEKRYGPSWSEENRFIGVNLASGEIDTKTPGFERGGEKRQGLLTQFLQMI